MCVFVEALQSLLEELLEDPKNSAGDRAILFAASLSCTKDFEMLCMGLICLILFWSMQYLTQNILSR